MQQAQSRLGRANVSRFQAEMALTQDRAAYLRLVGSEPYTLLPPELSLPASENLNDTIEQAETQNPDVLSAHYAVEEAKAQIKLNRGERGARAIEYSAV